MNSQIEQALKVLQSGGIIVYPTETAYAVGCDATNATAIAKIFAIKKREMRLPLPLIVVSIEMAKEYVTLGTLGDSLAQKFWPGPLTLVAHSLKSLPEGVVASDGSVALRVSSNEIAAELSKALGKPIVSTSANISGQANCYSLAEARGQLGELVDYYFDGGLLAETPSSTIVDVAGNTPKILRQGSIRI